MSQNIEVISLIDRKTMKRETAKLKDGREVLLRPLSPEDKDRLMKMAISLSKDALRWSNPPYDEAKVDRWMGGAEAGLSCAEKTARERNCIAFQTHCFSFQNFGFLKAHGFVEFGESDVFPKAAKEYYLIKRF